MQGKEKKELVKETVTRTYRIICPDGRIRYETDSKTMELDDDDDNDDNDKIGFDTDGKK